jgi:hypothetical protein
MMIIEMKFAKHIVEIEVRIGGMFVKVRIVAIEVA